jgi:hypothetical protein
MKMLLSSSAIAWMGLCVYLHMNLLLWGPFMIFYMVSQFFLVTSSHNLEHISQSSRDDPQALPGHKMYSQEGLMHNLLMGGYKIL